MENPKKPEQFPTNADAGSLLVRIDTLIVTPDAPAGHRRALELLVEARAEIERLQAQEPSWPQEERATKILEEWRELLIQERLANTAWDALTDEQRKMPYSSEHSRSARRSNLEKRVLDFQAHEQVRERFAQRAKAIQLALATAQAGER